MDIRDTTVDDLTEQQAAFVHAWLALGARKGEATNAMRQVNPELTDASAQQTASRYQRDPKILAAIRNLADASLRANVLLAQDTLTDIMEGDFNGQVVKPETAMKAAVEILNRAGLNVASEVNVNITDNRTEKELLAFIKQKAEALGMPLKELGVIDADFEEVDAGAPYGRKESGVPRQKPGRKPWKRRLLAPPETEKQKAEREQVKKVREQLKAAREAQKDQHVSA